MPEQQEQQFKTPTTVEEIGVHMFYIRNAVQKVDKKIEDLAKGLVTRDEMTEHLKADADHEARIRVLESQNDSNAIVKKVVFGMVSFILVAVLSAVIYLVIKR